MEQSKRFESLDMRILNKGFLKKKKSKSKYLNLLFTGDEGIEPPLKVLETLVIPFDQSPKQDCLIILLHIKRNVKTFFIVKMSFWKVTKKIVKMQKINPSKETAQK